MKKLHYMLVSAIENRFHELLALGSHCFHILQFVKYKSQFELIVKGVHVCTMQFALLQILFKTVTTLVMSNGRFENPSAY